jgi:hypothetical protein
MIPGVIIFGADRLIDGHLNGRSCADYNRLRCERVGHRGSRVRLSVGAPALPEAEPEYEFGPGWALPAGPFEVIALESGEVADLLQPIRDTRLINKM